MREIKFRGKRLDNGEWVHGFYTEIEHNEDKTHKHSYIMPTPLLENQPKDQPVMVEVELTTVGQYTGLKDKNGVEIFEGDIIKTINGMAAVVEWDGNNGRFLGFAIARERKIVYVGREPVVEVIGNIHQNPNLLAEGGE